MAGKLVDWLVDRQQLVAMKDQEFAALLGCSRTMWVKIRSGDRKLSREMITRASRQWRPFQQLAAILPDLESDMEEREEVGAAT